MKVLTVTFNGLLQDKRVRGEQSKYESVQRVRSVVVNRYKRAYQEFLDLEAGLQSAKNWYREMKETVQSLERNVDTFVNNRRSEGAQLLGQIEQDRAASKSSQASIEQERLRGLMERMSMEPPGSPGKPPTSARNTPAPLSFSPQTPVYPKTNFSGQYQVPSSPPPTQTNMPQSFGMPQQQQHQQQQPYAQQHSYNPGAHGRMPGPVSPPPTQTSFAIGPTPGMRPGPSSPPPTQTSFASSQPSRFSTYGNPNAQPAPQSYVPPGFVPPPPPPGPPPLGPQQTFHYNNGEYYRQSTPGSRPVSTAQPHGTQQGQGFGQPEASQDPWAGLNAWK